MPGSQEMVPLSFEEELVLCGPKALLDRAAMSFHRHNASTDGPIRHQVEEKARTPSTILRRISSLRFQVPGNVASKSTVPISRFFTQCRSV